MRTLFGSETLALHLNGLVVRRILVILLVVGIGSACHGGASTQRDAGTEIDALFVEWNKPDSAGCGVGVNRNGPMVFERGYGRANIEGKVRITHSVGTKREKLSEIFRGTREPSCRSGRRT